MGVRLYRVQAFEHTQENEAFEILCRAAVSYMADMDDVRIVGNVSYPGGQMDVLVLARHSITIVDFKNWSGTIVVALNRPWLNEESKAVLGGSYANPFQQMCAYRNKLQAALSTATVLTGNDFSHISGLVLFTQPVEILDNPHDPIGPRAGKWFHVEDWTGGIQKLRNLASPKIDLSAAILDELVADLNAHPFVPISGGRLVPETAIIDALLEQEFARMADWEAEHRDEIRADYEEAQEGWQRLDYPEGNTPGR